MIDLALSAAKFRDVAQPGSAPDWGSGGRGFESRHPDQYSQAQTARPLAGPFLRTASLRQFPLHPAWMVFGLVAPNVTNVDDVFHGVAGVVDAGRLVLRLHRHGGPALRGTGPGIQSLRRERARTGPRSGGLAPIRASHRRSRAAGNIQGKGAIKSCCALPLLHPAEPFRCAHIVGTSTVRTSVPRIAPHHTADRNAGHSVPKRVLELHQQLIGIRLPALQQLTDVVVVDDEQVGLRTHGPA